MNLAPSDHSVDGPSERLAGPGFVAAARRAVLATRPAFYTASALPVLVGTVWAAVHAHRFDGLLFGLALAATVLAHAASNVWNDVGDDFNGTDANNTGRMYPYTGGSRFIQTGLMSRHAMVQLAAGLALAALGIGIALIVLRGTGILWLGATGLGLGLLYSLPGAQLCASGLGEAAVGIGLGALPVLGAAWLQTGEVDLGAVLLAIQVSCWVTAILVINEVPDMAADAAAGKRTLVVRFGPSGARALYGVLTAVALVAALAAISVRALPYGYAVIAALLCFLACRASFGISSLPGGRARLRQSIEITLAIHAGGCVALMGALAATRLV